MSTATLPQTVTCAGTSDHPGCGVRVPRHMAVVRTSVFEPVVWCRGCRPSAPPVTADDFDLTPLPVPPVKPPHWLVDALRTTPRLLLFATGFGLGGMLVASDMLGALVLDHIGFRLAGI